MIIELFYVNLTVSKVNFFGRGWGWGASRGWALILGWALNQINTITYFWSKEKH